MLGFLYSNQTSNNGEVDFGIGVLQGSVSRYTKVDAALSSKLILLLRLSVKAMSEGHSRATSFNGWHGSTCHTP